MENLKSKIISLSILCFMLISCNKETNPLLGTWENDKFFEITSADFGSSSLLYGDSIVGERWHLGTDNPFYKLESITFSASGWELNSPNNSLYSPYTLLNDSIFETRLAGSKYVIKFQINGNTLLLKGRTEYPEKKILSMENADSSINSLKITGEVVERKFIKQTTKE